VSAQPGACPRCGAPYTAGQQYCLECGQRLPTTVGWTARFQGRRWYPGDWIWPVLVFLLLAGLGALIAILATRDTTSGTDVAFSPPPTTGGGQISTSPAPPTTTAPPPATTAPPRTTPAPRNRVIAWPSRSGYTIVLASIPTTSGRAKAAAAARRALAAGLPQVGILTSSSYPSLQPGYYVVFTGVYGSESDAEGRLETARSAGFASPYVKPVST
jgi:hypothetical protein